MALCINKSLPEFKQLVEDTGLPEQIVMAKVSVWQDLKNSDRFPLASELVPEKNNVQEKLLGFLNQFGFEINDAQDVIIDLAAKTIDLDKSDIDQVSKAMAEPLAEMLSYSDFFFEVEAAVKGTPRYRQGIKEWTQKLGKYDRNTKRQAAKEIFKELLDSGFNEELAKRLNIKKSLLERIKEFVNKFIDSLRGANWDVINRQINTVVENTFKGDDFIRLTKKDGYKQVDFQEAFDGNAIAKDIMTKIGTDKEIILTGSIAYATQGTVYRKIETVVHDLDFINNSTLEHAEKLLFDNFPDSIHAYSFPTPNYQTDTYLVPPVGTVVTDIKRREGGKKIISYNVRNKETNEIVGTYKLDYDLIGSKITNERETKTGTEAMLVDFFTNSSVGSKNPIQHDFVGSDGELYQVNLANYVVPFTAKLEFSRFKDIWDYNRFIPARETLSTEDRIFLICRA
jgi:hypothetical protein